MERLSRVLFHLDPVEPDAPPAAVAVDPDASAIGDAFLELRNLISLRQVRVEVLLPCEATVVGDVGAGPREREARSGGALYLTRPVPVEDWQAILSHVLTDLPEGEPRGAANEPARRGP